MNVIRAFIAIHLPAPVQEVVAAVSQELAPRVPEGAVTWVRPERMHLTLRFLGETPVAKLDDLAAGLDTITARHAPFRLELGRLGCFPSERRPRVIWVGVAGDTAAAAALQQEVEALVVRLGWPAESKGFSPHLTLGRVKRRHEEVKLPWGSAVVPQAFRVAAIYLVESELRRDGPLYTVRHQSRLG